MDPRIVSTVLIIVSFGAYWIRIIMVVVFVLCIFQTILKELVSKEDLLSLLKIVLLVTFFSFILFSIGKIEKGLFYEISEGLWLVSSKAALITSVFVLAEIFLLSLSDKEIWAFFQVVSYITLFLTLSSFFLFWIFK